MTKSPPNVPDEAVKLAAEFEGFSATPYRDPVGIWTIGFGSTRDTNGHPVTAHTAPVTRPQAEGLMRRDLTAAAITVNEQVRVPLNDHERAALESFIYNVGAGAFAGSTMLRLINAGQLAAAAEQFERWDKAGGKVLAGLLRRRLAEKALFVEKG